MRNPVARQHYYLVEAVDTFLSINSRAAQIPDSVRKLRFLRHEMEEGPVAPPAPDETWAESPRAEDAAGTARAVVLQPCYELPRNELALQRTFKAPVIFPRARPRVFRKQFDRFSVGTVLAVSLASLIFVVTGVSMHSRSMAKRPSVVPLRATEKTKLKTAAAGEEIWLVEKTPAYWVYSNGLQIRTEYLTKSTARHYLIFRRGDLGRVPAESNVPAGIVFHTTESLMLPFEPGQAHSLMRTREAILDMVRNGRLYNYLIDRFGQVFRVVPDDEVANHAGHSVWADDRNVYEGLNDSFLGVAFEARTHETFLPDPAQIRSGRMLIDLLRSEYSIPAMDCVTHAQVSVNPANMQIGYHTDWAANFPFGEFGLPDGYATPLPAIELFGFGYNRAFLNAIGGKPWEGLLAADADLRRAAEAQSSSTTAYRNFLQRKYQAIRSQNHEPTDRDRT